MEEESKTGGFVIKDKRRFSSEGNFQGEEGEASSFQESTSKSPDKSAAAARPPQNTAQEKSGSSPKKAASQDPTASDAQFHSLIVSLATQALVLLGEAPGPEGMEIEKDIQAAKQTIDMLLMLQEKTRGNIREEEDHLLTEILRELQMGFVRATKK